MRFPSYQTFEKEHMGNFAYDAKEVRFALDISAADRSEQKTPLNGPIHKYRERIYQCLIASRFIREYVFYYVEEQ